MLSKKRICLGIFVTSLLICGVVFITACSNYNKDPTTITSMPVSYTQGDNIVYSDMSFEELKSFLIVTVAYVDGTEKNITDYMIAGTLTVGESILTISYKNFKNTITVLVSEKKDETHSHSLKRFLAQPATCTENGNIEYWYCLSCGKYYSDQSGDNEILQSDTITLASHTPVMDEAVEPTCAQTGLTAGSHCSVCSIILVHQEIINALGHSFTNYLSNNDETCTEDGTKTAKCDRCDERETVTNVGSKLGHDLFHYGRQEPTCTAVGWKAYNECSRCNYTTYEEILALGHIMVVDNAVTATCTKSGLTEGKHCSRCNEILVAQKVVSAFEHKKVEAIEENRIEATCTAVGYCDSVIYCSICGEELSRKKNEIMALGHNLIHHEAQVATCKIIGWNAYDTCLRCNYTTYKEISKKAHQFGSWSTVKESTNLDYGQKVRICNVCKMRETSIVEKITAVKVNVKLSHKFVTGFNVYPYVDRVLITKDGTDYKVSVMIKWEIERFSFLKCSATMTGGHSYFKDYISAYAGQGSHTITFTKVTSGTKTFDVKFTQNGDSF